MGDVVNTLSATSGETGRGDAAPCVAYGIQSNTIGRQVHNGGNGLGASEEIAPTLTKADRHGVATQMQVRRLTPRECERLQGFPDDYTLVPYRGKSAEQCPDGPRYKALGNSMAVPVMGWIGERIQQASEINQPTEAAA